MTKLIFLLLALPLTCGCDYSGSQNTTKIKSISTEQLLIKNKNRFLFLRFWDRMTEQEFNQIVKYENEKGNLKDGKFLLMTSSSKEIPFEIKNYDDCISLYYDDIQWSSYVGASFYALNKIPNGKSYYYIEKTIIDLFDNKYERISLPSIENKEKSKTKGKYPTLEEIEEEDKSLLNKKEHETTLKWKSFNENKIIILHSNYSFFKNDFDYNTAESGATAHYPHDRENKNIMIGECSIRIYYEFLDEYLERENERENEQKIIVIEQKKQKEQERKELDNKIKKNNSNL